jgi:hypothetical protein
MKLAAGFALVAVTSAAVAQETAPAWAFEEIIVSVVEVTTSRTTPILNNGTPQVITRRFRSSADCEQARVKLMAFGGVTLPLGTGGGAQAHIGRLVSECFAEER